MRTHTCNRRDTASLTIIFHPVCRVLFSQNFKLNETQWFNNFDKLMTNRVCWRCSAMRLWWDGLMLMPQIKKGKKQKKQIEWKTASNGIQLIFKWRTRMRESIKNLNGQLSFVQRNCDFHSNQFSVKNCFCGGHCRGTNYHENIITKNMAKARRQLCRTTYLIDVHQNAANSDFIRSSDYPAVRMTIYHFRLVHRQASNALSNQFHIKTTFSNRGIFMITRSNCF